MHARFSSSRRPWSRARTRLPALAAVALALTAGPGAAIPSRAAQTAAPTAAELLTAAIDTMGGEDAVQALATARIRARGHGWALEQSERPEGPWIVSYRELEEWLDVPGGRLRTTQTMVNGQIPDGAAWTEIYDDGVIAIQRGERIGPGFSLLAVQAQERLALGPAAALLTARDAGPGAPRRTMHEKVPHWVVPFDWQDGRVELLLNADTGLPSTVRLFRSYPQDNMLGIWGQVTTEHRFHYWKIGPGGWRYPYQWETYRNGQPLETRLVLEVEPAARPSADAFTIPADVIDAWNAQASVTRLDVEPGQLEEPVEIAEGVVLYPGWWNVMLVEQEEGVVIVEGPISSEYSEKILAEVERRFPGKPVKAVINTSDAWPHIGGLRTYAAREVPIWTQPRNAPLLRRLMAAPYIDHPDLLERQPRAAEFEWVDRAREIPSSRNPVLIAPIDGEWSDRMLMVWLPDQRVLYGADLVFPPPAGRTGYFMPNYLEELRDAARREGFAPEQVVAMHSAPLPWSQILEAIEKAHAAPSESS